MSHTKAALHRQLHPFALVLWATLLALTWCADRGAQDQEAITNQQEAQR